MRAPDLNTICTDPLRWLAGLQSRPYPVLLDSGQPASPSGRYSIVAAEPKTVWVAHGPDALAVWERQDDGEYGQIDTLTGSVLGCLGQLRSTCPLPDKDNGSFNGGLIGLLPYPLGAPGQLTPAPRATVYPTSQLWAWVGDYDRAVIIDHQTDQVQFVGAGGQWQPAPEPPTAFVPAPERLPVAMTTSLPRPEYLENLQRIKDHLHAGDIYQVNLTRQFFTPWAADPVATYMALRHATPMPFCGYLDLGVGQLLSLSPERFLQVNHRQLETKPIKGTRPRGQSPEQDQALIDELMTSKKDRAENLMIVDLLRNDLGKTAVTGSVQVPHLFALESFANVHQLVSTVTAELRPDYTPLQALLSAFPGGSITGAPKKRAMEIIAELEPHNRGAYCGTLFYADVTGRLDSNILIRSAWLEDGQLSLWSGGGIVWGSEPEAEYQETHDKIDGLAAALGLRLP